jgi:hypothetical protein
LFCAFHFVVGIFCLLKGFKCWTGRVAQAVRVPVPQKKKVSNANANASGFPQIVYLLVYVSLTPSRAFLIPRLLLFNVPFLSFKIFLF